MPRAKRSSTPPPDQLKMDVEPVPAGQAAAGSVTEALAAVELIETVSDLLPPPAMPNPEVMAADPEPFGGWLLKQGKSGRWYSPLTGFAKADRRFPKAGDPDAVRKHMEAGGADGEVMDMLDDAERDWSRL